MPPKKDINKHLHPASAASSFKSGEKKFDKRVWRGGGEGRGERTHNGLYLIREQGQQHRQQKTGSTQLIPQPWGEYRGTGVRLAAVRAGTIGGLALAGSESAIYVCETGRLNFQNSSDQPEHSL